MVFFPSFSSSSFFYGWKKAHSKLIYDMKIIQVQRPEVALFGTNLYLSKNNRNGFYSIFSVHVFHAECFAIFTSVNVLSFFFSFIGWYFSVGKIQVLIHQIECILMLIIEKNSEHSLKLFGYTVG